jgi:hypothetical protein
MKICNIEAAIIDWFYATIFPSLPWHVKVGSALLGPSMLKKIEKQNLEGADDLVKDGVVDMDVLQERIDQLFDHVPHLEIPVGTTVFKLTRQSVDEILDTAEKLEMNGAAAARA